MSTLGECHKDDGDVVGDASRDVNDRCGDHGVADEIDVGGDDGGTFGLVDDDVRDGGDVDNDGVGGEVGNLNDDRDHDNDVDDNGVADDVGALADGMLNMMLVIVHVEDDGDVDDI